MAVETTIQRKINKGYRIAARHLGHLFAHYRPQGSGPVITNLNMVNQLMCAIDPDPAFGFGKPLGYKTDEYYGLVDLTTVAIGDYFTDMAGDMLFVANFEPLKPSLFVRCNTVITILRPASNNGYGGDTGPITLSSGWPASILPGTKGQENVSNLPESVRAPWIIVHVPVFPGVDIRYGDVILDDLTRRYVVSQNQRTAYNSWHLTCAAESV